MALTFYTSYQCRSLSFKKITVIQSDKEYMEKREVNGGDVDGKISTFQDSQDHNHQEEVAEQPCQSDHYYNEVGNDNCGKFSGHEDKIHINKKQLAETFRSEQRNHGTISEPLQPAEEVGGNLSRDLKQVWEDDDLFGMKGMNIQRVDSVESLMDGDVAYQKEEQELGQGQDYAYHQDYYDQDEVCLMREAQGGFHCLRANFFVLAELWLQLSKQLRGRTMH